MIMYNIEGKFSKKEAVHLLLCFFVFVLSFWWVTWTADWEFYEVAYDMGTQGKGDTGFIFIEKFIKSQGYNFQSYYRILIVLMALLFTYLFHKLGIPPLLTSILFVFLMYVPLANQLRFYLAFPISILALYHLLYKGQKVLSLVLSIIAVLIHGSLLLFFAVVLIYFLLASKKKKIVMNIVLINIVIAILFSTYLTELVIYMGDYSYYVSKDQMATITGGIYRAFPFYFGVTLIYIINRNIKKIHPTIFKDKGYRFLFVLSTATILLLFICFRVHILIHRFMDPLIFVWLSYFLYTYKNYSNRSIKKQIIYALTAIVIVRLLWATLIPYIFGINNSFVGDDFLEILLSTQSHIL